MQREKSGYFSAALTSAITMGVCTYAMIKTFNKLFVQFVGNVVPEERISFIFKNMNSVMGYLVTIFISLCIAFGALRTFVRFVTMRRQLRSVNKNFSRGVVHENKKESTELEE